MGIFELPEGYAEIKRVDLQKDKKLAVLINLAALIIAALLIPIGLAIAPIHFASIMQGTSIPLFQLIIVLGGVVVYMVCHELIHGIFIKIFSGKKAKYGFTGLYAYAGSDAYFNKRHYLIIALAPVVLFGLIFLILNITLPLKWFWFIYVLQIINLSGAAGDLYITYLMRKLPDDMLTRDAGVGMIFYSKKAANG